MVKSTFRIKCRSSTTGSDHRIKYYIHGTMVNQRKSFISTYDEISGLKICQHILSIIHRTQHEVF